MAKRNKKIITDRRPKMKLEALESRQLLASDIFGGVEVASDVVVNGNTFDQILMTGSSFSGKADPGQILRVAYTDLDGSIVEVEFSGSGTLNISLANFGAAAEAANYNQPGVEYVSGHATITIEGSNSNSNLSIYSIGPATDFAPGGATANPIFLDANNDPLGNTYGQADIQSVIVVNDPNGAGDLFGSMFLGNVQFSGDTGIVGISAPDTNPIGRVAIGGLNAQDAAVPTLEFQFDSQFGTLNVVGGSIVNGSINALNVEDTEFDVNFVDGINASGDMLRASTTGQGVLTGVGVNSITIAPETVYDLTGKTQSDITSFFQDRVFTKSIIISGDLDEFFEVKANEFRGDLIFTGALEGDITVEDAGIGGDFILEKGIAGTGSITLAGGAGNVGGLFRVGSADQAADLAVSTMTVGNLNDVQIWGDMDADITATKIGSVIVKGDVKDTILGSNGIGDVLVEGDVKVTGDFLATNSSGSGDTAFGHIGTVTVNGDTNVTGDFIDIRNLGTFGNVSLLGGSGKDQDIGRIYVDDQLGASKTTGSVMVTAGAHFTMTGFDIDTAGGQTAGGLTVTGDGDAGDTFTFSGTFDSVITSTGFETFNGLGTANKMVTSTGAHAVNIGAVDQAAQLNGGSSFTLDGVNGASVTILGDTTGAVAETVLKGGTIFDGFEDFSTGNSEVSIDGDLTLTSQAGDEDGKNGKDDVSISFGSGLASNGSGSWMITADGTRSVVDFGSASLGVVAAGKTSTFDLDVTSESININGLLSVTDTLGTVSLTGDVDVDDLTGFFVNNSVNSVTVDGKLTVGDDDGAGEAKFLEINDGSLGTLMVTGKTVANDGSVLVDLNDDDDGDTDDAEVAANIELIDVAEVDFNADGGSLVTGSSTEIASLKAGKLKISTNGNDLLEGVSVLTAFEGNGDITSDGGEFLTGAKTVGDVVVNGKVTLDNGELFLSADTIGSVDVNGTATLVNSGGGATIHANDSIGSLEFDSLLMATSTGTVIEANDSSPDSALDTIGDITIKGKVTGGSGTDISASSIGNLSIVGGLTANNQSLIQGLKVLAAPHGDGDVNTTYQVVVDGEEIEQVGLDGTDIEKFGIGNITIETTLDKAYTGTALFAGDNEFIALGGIGDITLTGGVSGGQQSRLFNADTDAAWFSVGDGDGSLLDGDDTLDNGIFGLDTNYDATDVDTNGDVKDNTEIIAGGASYDPDYTGGTVTVGNVVINAQQFENTPNVSEVLGVSGAAGTSATIEGFAILSGAFADGGGTSAGDLVDVPDNAAIALANVHVTEIHAALKGTVGTVNLSSNIAFGHVETEALGTALGADAAAASSFSGIFAQTSIGDLQGEDTSDDMDATGDMAIIGDKDGVDDAPAVLETEDGTAGTAHDNDQLILVVI